MGVQLLGGHTEIWQVLGAAERTAAGQPVYLAGSMKDITAPAGPNQPAPDPSPQS